MPTPFPAARCTTNPRREGVPGEPANHPSRPPGSFLSPVRSRSPTGCSMTVDIGQAGADLPARILIFSHRNIFPKDLWRCPHYEFEDVIREIDRADIWAPDRLHSFPLRSRVAHRLMHHCSIPSNPGISTTRITKSYDLFFAICAFSTDLLELAFDRTWKDRCRTSVCLL